MGSVFKKIVYTVKRMADVFDEDRVAVYAGEAAFFVLISTVPCIMLFILVLGAVYPVDADTVMLAAGEVLPQKALELGGLLMEEVLNGSSSVPLVRHDHNAALVRVKGIRAIGDGLQNIFDEEQAAPLHGNVFISFGFTLLFIVLIAVVFLFWCSERR